MPLPPVLVSNTGQTTVDYIDVGYAQDRFAGLAFTTGDNTAGYTLSEVDVRLNHVAHTSTRVSIYTTSSDGRPGTSLHELTSPSSITKNAINTFTAASGAALDANTTYAVVIELTEASSATVTAVSQTEADSEDTGAASGWSIADQGVVPGLRGLRRAARLAGGRQ